MKHGGTHTHTHTHRLGDQWRERIQRLHMNWCGGTFSSTLTSKPALVLANFIGRNSDTKEAKILDGDSNRQ